MAKKLAILALRLITLNFVSIFIVGIVISWDNEIYRWIVNGIFTVVLFAFVWADASSTGQKDVQKDKIINRKVTEEGYVPKGSEGKSFVKWFGFAAGILAQVPVMLLIIVALFFKDDVNIILIALARAWFMSYSQLVKSLESLVPYILFVFPVIFALVAGFGYLNGPAQQKRLEVIIARNNAKKAKRMQDEKKNKKKGKPGFNSMNRR